ncbi:unnamed protein product [Rotaria sp. Silwood2]|nr:unnamed protein product [Rotaria sp. Silwood2]CAF2871828.1 unnamed protein product [Rotaria sp. Silwood2]CAF3293263.1 unnamed protein product [Rotaria sp. Silwood2]CAF4115258.1 unnamed protein product [Rotaria sp. Silwood2]CAF4209754.1 unnamed protein product [Rotaria sp. Silwood2]
MIFFLQFVKKLNSSYDVPSRKKLAHEILTQEVLYLEDKNESLLAEAAHLPVNIDGWSDRCCRSLYEYKIITDSLYRLESVLAKASLNVNIISKIPAIVTDNPNAMHKMHEMSVSKPGNQHILELRCFSHAINLMTGKNFM